MHPTVKFHETTTTNNNSNTDTGPTTVDIPSPPPPQSTNTNNDIAPAPGATGRGGRSARQRQQHTTSTSAMSGNTSRGPQQHGRRNRSTASANYVTPKSPTEERADSLADRYKTSPCKNYIQGEKECPYEQRCMFAHGEEELRTRAMNVADGLTTEEAIKNHQRSLYNKETPTTSATTRHQRQNGARRFSHSMSGSGRRSSQRSTPHSSSEGFGAKSTTPTDTEDSPLTPIHADTDPPPPRPARHQRHHRPHSRFASGDSNITTLVATSSSSSLNFSPMATPLVTEEQGPERSSEDALSSLISTPIVVTSPPRGRPQQQPTRDFRDDDDNDNEDEPPLERENEKYISSRHNNNREQQQTQTKQKDKDDEQVCEQQHNHHQQPTTTRVSPPLADGIALPLPHHPPHTPPPFSAPPPLGGGSAEEPTTTAAAGPVLDGDTRPRRRYQHDPYSVRCLGVERDL